MRLEIDSEYGLRSLEHNDAQALFFVIDVHRKFLRRFLHWVDQTRSVADLRDFVERSRENEGAGRGLALLLERVRDREVCGVLALDAIDRDAGSAQIGYWLREDLQGQGLATRAAARLVDYAFSEGGLHTLNLRAARSNEKSRALAERLGFERAACAPGDAEDIVGYTLRRGRAKQH